MAQAYNFHARERRKSLYDPAFELHRTHQFAYNASGILTGTIFPVRSRAITVAVTVKRSAASPTGIILEFGSATTGLAIWFAVADGKIYAAAGDAAAADGITLAGLAPPQDQIIRIVFSVIPKSGKARLWLNGVLVASGTSSNADMPNGWSDGGNGAIGAVDGTVTTRVPVADRVTLANAVILSPTDAFHNQRPRQFFEVA